MMDIWLLKWVKLIRICNIIYPNILMLFLFSDCFNWLINEFESKLFNNHHGHWHLPCCQRRLHSRTLILCRHHCKERHPVMPIFYANDYVFLFSLLDNLLQIFFFVAMVWTMSVCHRRLASHSYINPHKTYHLDRTISRIR